MPIRTKHYAFIPRKKGGDHVFFFPCRAILLQFYSVGVYTIITVEIGLPIGQDFEFLLT